MLSLSVWHHIIPFENSLQVRFNSGSTPYSNMDVRKRIDNDDFCASFSKRFASFFIFLIPELNLLKVAKRLRRKSGKHIIRHMSMLHSFIVSSLILKTERKKNVCSGYRRIITKMFMSRLHLLVKIQLMATSSGFVEKSLTSSKIQFQ